MSEISPLTELSPAQKNILFNNVQNIITGRDAEIQITEAQANALAFYKNGILIIDRESEKKPHVLALREHISREGYQILEEIKTDAAFIKTLYDEKRRKSGAVSLSEQESNEITPMQREVIKILSHAASLHASDIHINVTYGEAQVRMRIDGDMVHMYTTSAGFAHSLLASAYNMADTADASYRILEYQAARISSRKSPLPKGLQGVRLQFNPLEAGGRYFIGRMLYAEEAKSDEPKEVSSLGFHGSHVAGFEKMQARPEGVNFISGPTGSGKSTTLKIALEAVYRLRSQKINILTIEDPPEYTIEGASQLPVTNVETEEERAAAYRKAISAALRSDPDVIMPGEARDKNVINLVFTAAMTGHQVWTSIHANSALAIFDRVKDQGVEPYKLYDPNLVTGLVAQRLLRQLCQDCRIPFRKAIPLIKKDANFIKRSTLNSLLKLAEPFLNSIYFVNSQGCRKCSGGYKGRSVVAEIITPDYGFMELMLKDQKVAAINYWKDALDGMEMKEHAYLKLINGIVDPRDLEDRLGPLDMLDVKRVPALTKLEERYKNG